MNKLDRTIKAELAMLANLEGEKTDMPLQFARALLRYYRPNFENLPPEEQHTLLERCCDRVNNVLESTRLLAEFLEYGAPSRDQRPSFGDPQRDVEAAMLKDVEGLTYSRIAEALGIAVPQRSYGAADYSSVGHMVKRGRGILERAYGQQGWPDVAAEMRAELSRWEVLGDKDRVVLRWSEAWRMDTQEVRDILEGARPDKSALYKIGSHYSVLTEIRDAFVNAQI
jgi:hypothetical protein